MDPLDTRRLDELLTLVPATEMDLLDRGFLARLDQDRRRPMLACDEEHFQELVCKYLVRKRRGRDFDPPPLECEGKP